MPGDDEGSDRPRPDSVRPMSNAKQPEPPPEGTEDFARMLEESLALMFH
jgi:hypothetical protein